MINVTLTPEQLGKAVRVNDYYRRRAGLRAWGELIGELARGGFPATDAEVADLVADCRATPPPLGVDGTLGPKTAAAIRGATWETPPSAEFFIIGGQKVYVPGVRVITPRSPEGLSFYGTSFFEARPNGQPVDLCVLHWTGDFTAHQAFNTLIARKLSVQLILNAEGVFYQCLDLDEAVARHARGVNPRSFGIEIVNPAEARFAPQPGRKLAPIEVNGDRTPYLGFTASQVHALVLALPVLCQHMKIPLLLPKAGAADGATPPDGVTRYEDARVATGAFKGVCGHFHVTRKKADPGATLFGPLRERGFGVG